MDEELMREIRLKYIDPQCLWEPPMRSITWCICAQLPTQVRLFVTPWNVACLTPLSMGFSRQEYWRGLPFPPPSHLPDPGIEPVSPVLASGFFFFFNHWATWEAPVLLHSLSKRCRFSSWHFLLPFDCPDWKAGSWLCLTPSSVLSLPLDSTRHSTSAMLVDQGYGEVCAV